MARKDKVKPTKKDVVVAFKVEPALAELLDRLPNKSEFIRKAIATQLGVACPLCRGKGVVPRGVHNHFAPKIAENDSSQCVKCKTELRVPLNESDFGPDDRDRFEQFFFGGPLYCEPCYEELPPCSDCGWHIAPEDAAAHLRQAHID